MKKCSSLNIVLAFCIILIVLLCVCAFVYRPHFSDTLSGNNADWGNFGDFFWGLGTMLFTALSVWILYKVNKQLHEYNEMQQEHQDHFALQIERDRQKFQISLQRRNELSEHIDAFQKILIDSVNKEQPTKNEMIFFTNRLSLLLWSLQALDWLPKEVQEKIETLLSNANAFAVSELSSPSNSVQPQPLFLTKVFYPSFELYKMLILTKNTKLKDSDFSDLITV